jgi:hypothetical protein
MARVEDFRRQRECPLTEDPGEDLEALEDPFHLVRHWRPMLHVPLRTKQGTEARTVSSRGQPAISSFKGFSAADKDAASTRFCDREE